MQDSMARQGVFLIKFKISFFHEEAPVTASEIFINFPGKHQWWRRNRFTE